ncbi:hypothetical protein D3C76_1405180 [compost metagenome]
MIILYSSKQHPRLLCRLIGACFDCSYQMIYIAYSSIKLLIYTTKLIISGFQLNTKIAVT